MGVEDRSLSGWDEWGWRVRDSARLPVPEFRSGKEELVGAVPGGSGGYRARRQVGGRVHGSPCAGQLEAWQGENRAFARRGEGCWKCAGGDVDWVRICTLENVAFRERSDVERHSRYLVHHAA